MRSVVPGRLGTARMPSGKIKAILFDLGDTLINFGKLHTARLFHDAARSSHAYLHEQHQPGGVFVWYFLRNLFHLKTRCFISNLTGRDFDALELLQTVSGRVGVKLSDEQWEHLAWLWYEPLVKVATIEPDLPETLTALKQQGYKVGIVSNTFVNRTSLERHMRELRFLDFFPLRMYSYEFKIRKPDRRIFRIAAERIGEAPEHIAFVGDRIDKDIRPALDCGMTAILKDAYTNAGLATPAGAIRIHLLSELPAILDQP
jgi:putative hydrolase of the HAD superfamily